MKTVHRFNIISLYRPVCSKKTRSIWKLFVNILKCFIFHNFLNVESENVGWNVPFEFFRLERNYYLVLKSLHLTFQICFSSTPFINLLKFFFFILCLIYLWPRQELKRRKTVSWLNFPDCEVLKSINYIQIKYLQLLLYFYFLREYFLLSLVSVYRLSIIFFFINI